MRLSFPLVVSLLCVSLTLAANPTSFCKCTCFKNSTIIPLGGQPDEADGRSPDLLRRAQHGVIGVDQVREVKVEDSKKATGGNCADCNRQFCLDYNLPICREAEEKDVFATCFQRDSTKDEAVVFIFIFATAGLLIYAAIRPWVDRWIESGKERQRYVPVDGEGD
ncbi:MAG: hypothetical protein M1817_002942 [Caeruleum heppii]|nr:MAG: hypothetical protein M1817_002942 [Caeruleum heppii]